MRHEMDINILLPRLEKWLPGSGKLKSVFVIVTIDDSQARGTVDKMRGDK